MSKADDVFIREFGIILGALFVFFILALLLARSIGAGAFERSQLTPREVAKRTAPVGEVRFGEAGQMAAAPEPAPAIAEVAAAAKGGDQVYQSACMACHASGAAGAPKLDDKAAWTTRAAQGLDVLIHSAINGKGVMPAKGGNASLSDDDIADAVRYMLEQSGVSAN